VLRGEATIASV